MNASSPNNIYTKHLSRESKKMLEMEEITKSFKEALILKHSLRGPKFKLTSFAKYLNEKKDPKELLEEAK